MARIGGRTLVDLSVTCALAATSIDAVFVSSEDDDILAEAARAGAECIRRPAELSKDTVTNLDVIRHAVAELETQVAGGVELLILMQPTHPLRHPGDLDRAVGRVRQDPELDSLVTVVPAGSRVGRVEGHRFSAVGRRLFRVTGTYYVIRPRHLLERDDLLGPNVGAMEMSRPEFEIDIDTAADLESARAVASRFADEFDHFHFEFEGGP